MGITISQVLASLEPCFYTRSVVRIALTRLTEKNSSSDEFHREIVLLILPNEYAYLPTQNISKVDSGVIKPGFHLIVEVF